MKKETIFIREAVMREISETLSLFPPESGGILGFDQSEIISTFSYDEKAGVGKTTYRPTADFVEKTVNEEWIPNGKTFAGIAHSHPQEAGTKPSKSDVSSAGKIMEANGMESLVLIIVSGDETDAYVAKRDGNGRTNISERSIEIVP